MAWESGDILNSRLTIPEKASQSDRRNSSLNHIEEDRESWVFLQDAQPES